MHYTVITPTADLRETPDTKAPRGKLESQLVFGEAFTAEKEKDGWLYGASTHDGYAGWVEKAQFSSKTTAPTHVIIAQRSDVYAEPTIKSPLLTTLSVGSKIEIDNEDEKYLHIKDTGWIYKKHALEADLKLRDPVLWATLFVETPYKWGGRSGFGIDCSGLVQVVFNFCGITTPRDTEQQIETIGKDVTHETPRNGDLVFFKGHVGIMCGDDIIVHANAFHMKTCIEPLAAVAERSAGITRLRRV